MKIVSSYGGPSPQDPLVPAGSFVRKKCNKKRLKLGKIMKKVSRHRCNSCNKGIKCRKGGHKGGHNGGVRYIKKILEKIVSRLNLQLFQKKPHQKQKRNVITVDNKIVNEIIKNK